MKAILSDVHGNLEALQAVLDDATRHHAEQIYCLGDLVGYGPNPRECVDLAMRWDVCLLGNHDDAVLTHPRCFGAAAERSIVWSRTQIQSPDPTRTAAARRWAFLSDRPHAHSAGRLLFLHGSPRRPLHEYVFPENVHNPEKMSQIFALFEHYCFNGHTHHPGIFSEVMGFHAPKAIDYEWRLDGRKLLCNVGSVGQPRDGDWRACYVLLNEDVIRFRRVVYDVQTTIKKIHDNDQLDDFLGDRLESGQ